MSDNKILTVGRTNGAYGVRGWVRVVPFEEPEILAATKRWFLTDIRGNTKTLEVEELKVHGQMLIARITGVLNKEDAAAASACCAKTSRKPAKAKCGLPT